MALHTLIRRLRKQIQLRVYVYSACSAVEFTLAQEAVHKKHGTKRKLLYRGIGISSLYFVLCAPKGIPREQLQAVGAGRTMSGHNWHYALVATSFLSTYSSVELVGGARVSFFDDE
jgi:hypothetical protein